MRQINLDKISKCERWLIKELTWYANRVDLVRQAAKMCGFTKTELRNARKSLGVVTTRINEKRVQNWEWTLPEGLKFDEEVIYKDFMKEQPV